MIYITQTELDKIHQDFKSDTHILINHNNQTISSPYTIIRPIQTLACSCCSKITKGRQWYNRDKGYGICSNCIDWILDTNKETEEEIKQNYGIDGIHYNPLNHLSIN